MKTNNKITIKKKKKKKKGKQRTQGSNHCPWRSICDTVSNWLQWFEMMIYEGVMDETEKADYFFVTSCLTYFKGQSKIKSTLSNSKQNLIYQAVCESIIVYESIINDN